MCDFEDVKIIAAYRLKQALEDGVLVEIFKARTGTSNKKIVATAHLCGETNLEQLMKVWDEFVDWRTNVQSTLPEEEQLFHTFINGKKVWVIEDAAAFTLLYPEDY